MRIALFGKHFNPDFLPYFIKIVKKLQAQNIDVVLYKKLLDFSSNTFNYHPKIEGTFLYHKEIKDFVTFLFSIGGDGTFLDSVAIVQNADIPIVGINSGRLGFLANISQKEIELAIEEIINHNYIIEKRDLLQLKLPKNVLPDFNYALNDISVTKKDTSIMVKIHVYLDDEFLNTYWADGLIISTPTGSTAYSLSVGGPILVPANNSFILSPISPHTLTVRPIVIPNKKTISLILESRDDEFIISLDSQYTSLKSGTKLIIKKADFHIKLLHRKNTSFYKTLRDKLMWGLDKEINEIYQIGSMRKISIIVCFVILLSSLKAQMDLDIGISAGTSFYLGDINPEKLFYNSKASFGGFLRLNSHDSRYSIRLNTLLASLNASDLDFSNQYQKNRKASFDTNIGEISAFLEFNFIPFMIPPSSKHHKPFSPFLLSGITYVSSSFSKSSMAIPVGVGFKFLIFDKLSGQIEWIMKKTFTDNLDNISDPINTGSSSIFFNTDWYSFAGISLSFKMFRGKQDCINYENYRQKEK